MARDRFGEKHEIIVSLITRIEPLTQRFALGQFRVGGEWIDRASMTMSADESASDTDTEIAGFSELQDLTGKTYKGVEVTKVDPNGLNIRHEGGALKLCFKDLPEEIRRKFGYNEDAARAFAEQEKAQMQSLQSSNAALKLVNSYKSIVEITLNNGAWETFANNDSLVFQFAEIRFFNTKVKTNSMSRKNSLGGAGLVNNETTRTRVYSDKRIVSIITSRDHLRTAEFGTYDTKVFPIFVDPRQGFNADLLPRIYSFEPDVASNLVSNAAAGSHVEILASMEKVAVTSARIECKVFQNLGNGNYLISVGEELYKLEGYPIPNLADEEVTLFAGMLTGETFEYTNAFNAVRSVGVIRFLSHSVEER